MEKAQKTMDIIYGQLNKPWIFNMDKPQLTMDLDKRNHIYE